jgi:hypothetical protein
MKYSDDLRPRKGSLEEVKKRLARQLEELEG